jgi:hypothetical protein
MNTPDNRPLSREGLLATLDRRDGRACLAKKGPGYLRAREASGFGITEE